jgi:hypothetical protein
MQEVIPPTPKLPGHWLGSLNWGHGMIGKATVAEVVLLLLLGVVATRVTTESALLWVCGFGLSSVFVYLFFLAFVAGKYPDIAATEGPTYVQSRRIAAAAAKGFPRPPTVPMVPDPQNPTVPELPARGYSDE